MNRSLTLSCCLLALSSFATLAQSPEYKGCLAQANGNSNKTFSCHQAELQRQDKRVDAEYRQLQVRAQHDPQKQADIRTDQRNWLEHRDFACSRSNGSERFPCMIRETAQKADQLEVRLH